MQTPEEIVKDPLLVKELFQCEEFLLKQLKTCPDGEYKEFLYHKFLKVSELTYSIRQLLKNSEMPTHH